ncbi:set domain protein [Aphelenchoides avenae]|nr:set domain protein [Aphelenchus avenae]
MATPLSSQENLIEDPQDIADLIKAPALASNHVSSEEEPSVSAQPSLGALTSSSTAAAEAPSTSGLVASDASGASKGPRKQAKHECKIIQETPFRFVAQPKGNTIDFPPRQKGAFCFVCGDADGEELKQCGDAKCEVAFHLTCVDKLPLGGYDKRFMARSGLDKLLCPLHHCSTCYNNERRTICADGPLEQCSQCETAWHADCRPAGCETVNGDIICPRHRSFPAEPAFHVNHCLHCNKRDQRKLVNCKRCLRAFHFDCMKDENASLTEDTAAYRAEALCFWCMTGDYPVVGQPCMARQGNSFWYPCFVIANEKYPLSNPNLGKLGYVAVEWLAWRGKVHYHSVLPYNRLIAMTESDFFFKVMGDTDSYTCCYEEWKQIQASFGGKKYATDNILNAVKKASTRSNNFKPITANKFNGVDKKSLPKKPEIDMCNCSEDAKDRCGPESGCLNRIDGKECPKACEEKPGGCNNRFIANKQKRKLEKFLTPGGERGHGLRAKKRIVKDAFIGEYIGELITEEEKVKRMAELSLYGPEAKHYFMEYAKGLYLDAQFKGNIMRYANHSCDPNTALVIVWSDDPFPHVMLKALRDIDEGEEITFDYNWRSGTCRCRAPNCTGFMSSKSKTTKTKTTTEPKKTTKSKKASKITADEEQPSTSKSSAPVPNKRKASSQPNGPQPSKRSKTATA